MQFKYCTVYDIANYCPCFGKKHWLLKRELHESNKIFCRIINWRAQMDIRWKVNIGFNILLIF